jgi:hypothetical protein
MMGRRHRLPIARAGSVPDRPSRRLARPASSIASSTRYESWQETDRNTDGLSTFRRSQARSRFVIVFVMDSSQSLSPRAARRAFGALCLARG